jgi:hypothetical protein
MSLASLKEGDVVVRKLEGLNFPAKVVGINRRAQEVDLEYLDDGNMEKMVSFDDIDFDFDGRHTAQMKSPSRKINTLPKPLLGLVEDDYEIRNKHAPTIFVHEPAAEEESKSAIILHGAENKLAAGGGLRALRYLKK